MGLIKDIFGHSLSEIINPPYCGDGSNVDNYSRMDENGSNYSRDYSENSDYN